MVLDISKLVLMLESLQSSQQQKKGFVLCTSYMFDKCLIDVFIIGMIHFFWGLLLFSSNSSSLNVLVIEGKR